MFCQDPSTLPLSSRKKEWAFSQIKPHSLAKPFFGKAKDARLFVWKRKEHIHPGSFFQHNIHPTKRTTFLTCGCLSQKNTLHISGPSKKTPVSPSFLVSKTRSLRVPSDLDAIHREHGESLWLCLNFALKSKRRYIRNAK